MAQAAESSLNAEQVMAGLSTQIVGRLVRFYPSVGSTNVIARTMGAKSAGEGLVILADEQTAGRGRRGRRWEAPAGSSILMSLLLRPPVPANQAYLLTMMTSLAVRDGIRDVTNLDVGLKWPNDIVTNDRKVGGILTESSVIGDRIDFVVVGLGLNVNFDPADVAGIPPAASSLMVALGAPVDRLALVRSILEAADRRYRSLKAGESPHAAWARRLTTLGQRVRVTLPEEVLEGVADGVDEQGNLWVRQDDGTLVDVAAGDVVMLRPDED